MILEGKWEEIQRRSSELAGHKVRVEVLDDLPLPALSAQRVSAADWVQSFRQWAEAHDSDVPLLTDEAIDRESIYADR